MHAMVSPQYNQTGMKNISASLLSLYGMGWWHGAVYSIVGLEILADK